MRTVVVWIICSIVISAWAQAPTNHAYFGAKSLPNIQLAKDSSPWSDPKKVTILALALPGAGQIYNKRYLKAGIVYAGFGGLAYMYKFNLDSTRKYQAILANKIDGDSNTIDLLPNASESAVKSSRDFYRRNRDVAIIGFVALYALQAIDANVDAHLKEFKVNKDLSMKVSPEFFSNKNGLDYYNGLTLTFKF
jgi:hypothetical protein